MKCNACSRRQFLKLSLAAAGAMGFSQMSTVPGFCTGKPSELKVNVTARCIFASVVVTHEDQPTFPNPYKAEMNTLLIMNEDCSGVDQGVEAVRSGKADIGTLHRPLTPEEEAAGLVETQLNSWAYSVVVNKNNPVEDLTEEQVLKIFAGRIRNWKEVGGKDADIMIYKQKCGANYDTIVDRAIVKAGIDRDDVRLSEAVMVVDITDNQFEKIAALDMAITMAPRFFFEENTKALRINDILPSRATEKDGSYPFLARISLVSKKNPSEAVQNYLEFMNGPHGRELIEKSLALDWLKQGF